MHLRRPLSAATLPVLSAVVLVLLTGCGSAATTRSERRDGTTLSSYARDVSCESPRTVTALVSRSDKGCYLLDGYPVSFPRGTTWADRAGDVLRLPSGARLAPGDTVTGQVCTSVPQPLEATYDCGIGTGDPTHGLRTASAVHAGH